MAIWDFKVCHIEMKHPVGIYTNLEVTLAILNFFGQKALDMSEELDIEGLRIHQLVM